MMCGELNTEDAKPWCSWLGLAWFGFRLSRQQSKEEALAALVKARCTLDDFEPALRILATDEASPESIETWTLQQVCD